MRSIAMSSTKTWQTRTISRTNTLFVDRSFKDVKVHKRKQIQKNDNEVMDSDEVSDLIGTLKSTLSNSYKTAERQIRQQTRELVTRSKSGTAGLMSISIDGKPLASMASVSGSGLKASVNVYLAGNVNKVRKSISEADEDYKPEIGAYPTTIEVVFPSMNREKRNRLAKSLSSRCVPHKEAVDAVRRSTMRELSTLIKGIDQANAHITKEQFNSIIERGDQSLKDLLTEGKETIENSS